MVKYDAIVVGAGALGTFHAYSLAKLGKKVLLIERNNRQVNSSVMNFGQVVPSGQSIPTWRSVGIDSLAIYKSIQEKTKVSVRNNGSYYIASDEQELQLLEEMHEIDKGMDYPSFLLTPAELKIKFPTLKNTYVKGGLLYPQEFSVEPHQFVKAVSGFLAEQMQVTYLTNTLVIGCEIKNDAVEINTSDKRRFTADQVFICTSYELKTLFPEVLMNSGMQVSKLHMMITKPMKEQQLNGNILTGYSIRRYDAFHACPSYLKFNTVPKDQQIHNLGIHILFKQATDGRIIIGDSHQYAPSTSIEDVGYHIEPAINELMLKEAQQIMDLEHWEIDQYWCGYYMTHPNEIFTHSIENRIHLINGIGGKGMTCSGGFAHRNINQLYHEKMAV
jgi:FAD dependent oxidoreductase TIGR03364